MEATSTPRRERICLFDTLRGFTIISMVLFHAAYDATYLFGFDIPWFHDPVAQNIWRCSISWVFLLLAGWMTQLSRNNLKRAGIYGAAALTVFLTTSIANVDTPVSFGILFCMAASTLVYALASPILDRVHPALGVGIALALFALTYMLPEQRYDIEGLAWLGIPSTTFASGDYYPLMPYGFLYMAGMYAARLFARYSPEGYPAWMRRNWVPVLSSVGRASLVIYLIHQPLLICLFMLITSAA